MSETEYCSDCRFWYCADSEGLDADCRRHAPRLAGQIAPHGNAVFQDPKVAIWPTVMRDDWCGEFARSSS